MYATTAPSNCAIWDEFSEQLNNQRIKRHDIYCPINTLLVQIKCRFNAFLVGKAPS